MRIRLYREFFWLILLFSILVMFRRNSWIAWFLIEIVLFLFIIFCSRLVTAKYKVYESIAQIFVFKSIGGILILLGMTFFSWFLVLGILVSLALFPFHFWVIRSFRILPLFLIIIGGWIVKIIPLIIISVSSLSRRQLIILIAIFTSFRGVFRMVNSTSTKSLIVRRRVNQIGLVISSLISINPLIFISRYYLRGLYVIIYNSLYSWWNLAAFPPSPLFFFKVYTLYILYIISEILSLALVFVISMRFFPYLKFLINSKM